MIKTIKQLYTTTRAYNKENKLISGQNIKLQSNPSTVIYLQSDIEKMCLAGIKSNPYMYYKKMVCIHFR